MARQNEAELRKRLESGQAIRADIEEKFSTAQEEAAVKTKRLKRAFAAYMQAKAELEDVEGEHQREMEVTARRRRCLASRPSTLAGPP